MKNHFKISRRSSSQRGQAFLAIVVFVAFLLLAIMGLATDYSQIWAHRQMAQGAADAACEAGVADLFLKGSDPSATTDYPGLDLTWIGSSSFTCSAKPNSVPCKYASLNGYTGSQVTVSFPASLPGVPAIPPAFGTIANPYVMVSITEPVPMTFSRLAANSSTVNISASAGCGLIAVNTPVPLVVLHTTANQSIYVGGSASIKIIGGPSRSIQVNSNSATAVNVASVDLSLAGPSGTGADFAVFGGPATKPSGVNVGSTGNYLPGANPFGDPFASVAAPSAPAAVGSATPVPFGMNGCPDPNGCAEFAAGNYTSCTASGSIAAGANGCLTLPYSGGSRPKFASGGTDWLPNHAYAAGALIVPSAHNMNTSMFKVVTPGTSAATGPNPWNQTPCARQSDGSCTGGTQPDGGVLQWQNVGVVAINPSTAIFDPGLYYVGAGGFNLGSGSTARVSTATGDGNHGATFYFSTSETVGVDSNSGKSSACTAASSGSGTPNGCIVSYKVDGTVSTSATSYVPSQKLQCPSGSANPAQVPALVDGNILLGPCGPTVAVTDPYGSPDGNRGFLFFQNRATAASPSWGGGGQFLSSGFLYFHNGNGATCGTDTSCLTLKGNSGSGAYTLGNIVVDELSLGGSPTINMFLNPLATFSVLRPSLLM
jgi:hypothetical protein